MTDLQILFTLITIYYSIVIAILINRENEPEREIRDIRKLRSISNLLQIAFLLGYWLIGDLTEPRLQELFVDVVIFKLTIFGMDKVLDAELDNLFHFWFRF